ncbi:MAG: hypothetical protein J0L67_19075 [Cytophagales bacterium]|nr:hypothetical protein [Cytophagales bacterium]
MEFTFDEPALTNGLSFVLDSRVDLKTDSIIGLTLFKNYSNQHSVTTILNKWTEKNKRESEIIFNEVFFETAELFDGIKTWKKNCIEIFKTVEQRISKGMDVAVIKNQFQVIFRINPTESFTGRQDVNTNSSDHYYSDMDDRLSLEDELIKRIKRHQ